MRVHGAESPNAGKISIFFSKNWQFLQCFKGIVDSTCDLPARWKRNKDSSQKS